MPAAGRSAIAQISLDRAEQSAVAAPKRRHDSSLRCTRPMTDDTAEAVSLSNDFGRKWLEGAARAEGVARSRCLAIPTLDLGQRYTRNITSLAMIAGIADDPTSLQPSRLKPSDEQCTF